YVIVSKRDEVVTVELHDVWQLLVDEGKAEEGEEDDWYGEIVAAECRDAPPDEHLASDLLGEHAPERGCAGLGSGHHGAAGGRVKVRKASSRSAPTTSRSPIATPRRKSSRSSDSGSLVSRRTRRSETSM